MSKKIEWKDESTYNRLDKERVPWLFNLDLPSLTISVHRHRDYPGKWLMDCQELDFDNKVLKQKELAKAQKEAVETVYEKLEQMELELLTYREQ